MIPLWLGGSALKRRLVMLPRDRKPHWIVATTWEALCGRFIPLCARKGALSCNQSPHER